MTRTEAYDKIDRYLRNNLVDDDYAEYSFALELVFKPIPLENSQEAKDAISVVMKDYDYPLNPQNCARVGWRAARTYGDKVIIPEVGSGVKDNSYFNKKLQFISEKFYYD